MDWHIKYDWPAKAAVNDCGMHHKFTIGAKYVQMQNTDLKTFRVEQFRFIYFHQNKT